MMTNEELELAGKKAQPLFKVLKSGELKTQIEILKNLLKENGLEAGIVKLTVFCENKENKINTTTDIHSTDQGSMLAHVEYFIL